MEKPPSFVIVHETDEHLSTRQKMDVVCTCTMCNKLFVDPVTFPCDHSFCRVPCASFVLRGLTQGDKYSCPLCKTLHDFPECGIDELPVPTVFTTLIAMPEDQKSKMASDIGEIPEIEKHLIKLEVIKTPKGFRPGSESKIAELRRKLAEKLERKRQDELAAQGTQTRAKDFSRNPSSGDATTSGYSSAQVTEEEEHDIIHDMLKTIAGTAQVNQSQNNRRKNKKRKKRDLARKVKNPVTAPEPETNNTADAKESKWTTSGKVKVPERPAKIVTYLDKDKDGNEEVFWGDPSVPGPKLYFKSLGINQPDGKGTKEIPIEAPQFDSAASAAKAIEKLAELKKTMTDSESSGPQMNTQWCPTGADSRILLDEDLSSSFAMDNLHYETQKIYAKFKRNGGRSITKRISQEVCVIAESGGPKGMPNIRINVRPRNPKDFVIAKGSRAALALEATGLEVTEDNFEVEYATDLNGRMRVYLKPKIKKVYENFADFTFESWKQPGKMPSSGVTADGEIIYTVGREGHVVIKGYEEEEKQFDDMVMGALDEVE